MTLTFQQLLDHTNLPRLEARLLLQHASGFNHAQLIVHGPSRVSQKVASDFCRLVVKRHQGEPIAYLLGQREFYGRCFTVNPAVLIPRADTELLVETALSIQAVSHQQRVLELGTGSGIIAITLAVEKNTWHVTATDVSSDALKVAQHNADAWKATITFVSGDWFEAIGSPTAKFDMIVTNPPYIAHHDQHLTTGDLRFEPLDALTDHGDGLGHLRTIITQAPHYLTPQGFLLLEHGQDQGKAVRDILHQAGFYAISTQCDLAGHERVSRGKISCSG